MYKNNESQKIIIAETIKDIFDKQHLTRGVDVLTDMYLERLQRTVYALSELPDGNEYVHIIGNGNEENNLEALGTLIDSLSDVLSCMPTTLHLDKIMKELSNRFHDLRYLVTIH